LSGYYLNLKGRVGRTLPTLCLTAKTLKITSLFTELMVLLSIATMNSFIEAQASAKESEKWKYLRNATFRFLSF